MENNMESAHGAGYHPVHACNDGIINTLMGTISLLEPQTKDIRLIDIAYGMGNNCRFAGQTRHFFSVSQHTIVVYYLTRLYAPRLVKYALLHDATEGYIHDVTKQLKVLLGKAYTDIEDRLHTAICLRFGLLPDAPEWTELKEYDSIALDMEHEWLQKGEYNPLFLKMQMESAWSPHLARERFLHYCHLHNIY